MELCILLEINGAYPASSHIVTFIQYVNLTACCTSVDKHIAPA
jgi:hypothetical protein